MSSPPICHGIPSSLFFTTSESLSHIMTSSLLTILSPLYFIASPLYSPSPISLSPYHSSSSSNIIFPFILCHTLFIPHHSLYPMSSCLLYFLSPLLLLISFTSPFYSISSLLFILSSSCFLFISTPPLYCSSLSYFSL